MKWLLKISYSWGDEEPYQEFNSFEEAWDTAKKDACNEAEIASIEANDEKCEIGLTFEKEEDRGRIRLHYTYDNSYCYYDVLPQEVTDTDCIRQPEKADTIKISMDGGYLAIDKSQDSDYPGVDIEFVPDNEKELLYTRPRIVIEKPKGEKLHCLIWNDKSSEDYSDKIVFEN